MNDYITALLRAFHPPEPGALIPAGWSRGAPTSLVTSFIPSQSAEHLWSGVLRHAMPWLDAVLPTLPQCRVSLYTSTLVHTRGSPLVHTRHPCHILPRLFRRPEVPAGTKAALSHRHRAQGCFRAAHAANP